MQNLPIPASISQADFNALMAHFDAINTLLSFLHTLTPKERESARRLGTVNMSMARKAEELGTQFPIFFTLGHTLPEMSGRFEMHLLLSEAANRTAELATRLEDTVLIIEDKIYHIGVNYYGAGQDGVSENIPGAELVVQEMSKFFENMGPDGGPPADGGADAPTP